MRIAVIGLGKMGHAVINEARKRDHEVVAEVGEEGNQSGEGLAALAGVRPDVAIEFTQPKAAARNLQALIRLGIPTVSGTTGWYDSFPEIASLVEKQGAALLTATNFSIGAQLLFRLAGEVGRALAGNDRFDFAIAEAHHRRKVDAPSGTAITLRQAIERADRGRMVGMTSERVGWEPGIHRLLVDGEFESLTIEHRVRDRSVFAVGALMAAQWLVGRKGVYRFEDVLFGGGQ